MENITAEGLLRLGAKEWLKPGSDEVRYYINADKLLELADDYDVTNTMSNAEALVFSHNKWWFTESMHLKTSLSFKDTKHKYLMSSVPKLVQDLLEEI